MPCSASCWWLSPPFLTEWGHSSDSSILQWSPQCGEGTPPGRGHHQHHQPGEIQTVSCWVSRFCVVLCSSNTSVYSMLYNFMVQNVYKIKFSWTGQTIKSVNIYENFETCTQLIWTPNSSIFCCACSSIQHMQLLLYTSKVFFFFSGIPVSIHECLDPGPL